MVLQFADAQQSGDVAQQRVDNRPESPRRSLRRRHGSESSRIPALDPRPQSRQRRAELVRDIVADPAHIGDQQLQPIEHQVDVGAEQAEAVGRARNGQPPRQVTRHDPLCQAADGIHLSARRDGR